MSKKRKFVAQFTEAVGTDGGEVIVTADVLEVGAEVAVLDADLNPVENFSGEVTIEDTPVVITDNVIESMGAEEMEMSTEEVAVEEVEMAKEEEVVVETEMAVEDVAIEAYTKAEMDAKFDEIYSMIAELKTSATTQMAVEEVEMAETKTPEQIRMSKVEKLTNLSNNK